MSIEATSSIWQANLGALHELLETVAGMDDAVEAAARTIYESLQGHGKLLCCGNGGSATDSSHLAAEIAGRFVIERSGWPAHDLTADHGLLTALINDYPPEQVFSRQLQAFGRAGDVLAAFSTSGNSANVYEAIHAARSMDIRTIAFLGRDGGKCKGHADVEFVVPSDVTARIQEIHKLLYHTLCEVLDPLLEQPRPR